jgi:hypothetical protein
MSTDISKYKRVKQSAFWLMRCFGANYFLRRRNRDQVRIFALHGVADYDADTPWVPLRDQMHVSLLDKMLKALSRQYTFVPLEKAVRIIKGEEPAVDNCVALTFDDGYRNNFEVALPILRKYSIPATFYIATDFVESRRPFWFDRLDYVIQKSAEKELQLQVGKRTFQLEDSSRSKVKKSTPRFAVTARKSIMTRTSFLLFWTGWLSNWSHCPASRWQTLWSAIPGRLSQPEASSRR